MIEKQSNQQVNKKVIPFNEKKAKKQKEKQTSLLKMWLKQMGNPTVIRWRI